MDRLPLDRILATNRSMQRYHLRFEMPPTVIAEADLDLTEGRQYWQIGRMGQPYPLPHVYWDHEESHARLAGRIPTSKC